MIHPDRERPWLRRLLPLVRAHRWLVAVTLLTALLQQLLAIAGPFVLRAGIDDALTERTHALAPFAWALLGLAIARLLAGMAHRRGQARTGAELQHDLRALIQSHLGRASFSYYDQAHTGQLISRANSDIRSIESFLVYAPNIAIYFVGFLIALVLMARIHVGLTLVVLCTMPIVYAASQRMRHKLWPVAWLAQARNGDVAQIVEENVAGAHVVRAMAVETDQIRRLARAAGRLRWVSDLEVSIRARFQPLIQNLTQLAVAVFLLYGGNLVIDGSITIGTLVLFTAYLGILQPPIRMLGYVVMMAQRASASASRVFEITDTPSEIVDAPDAHELEVGDGTVRFRNVTFSYENGPDVLRGFDLTVHGGETLALVGRTGSGKSTAARLIPRFYDVRAGAVEIDGTDVRDVTLTSLRRQVGVVLDEPFLFTCSVRDNIAFARPDAEDAEVAAAAAAAGATDFITALPDGFDTVVGERGYTLSGGQRQRIAIARALLANPAVLILDDATSAIDVEVEQAIHAALDGLLSERTTLIIAHRRSTIALADRVAVLDEGRIVDAGTHDELWARSHLYRDILAHGDDSRDAEASVETMGVA